MHPQDCMADVISVHCAGFFDRLGGQTGQSTNLRGVTGPALTWHFQYSSHSENENSCSRSGGCKVDIQ